MLVSAITGWLGLVKLVNSRRLFTCAEVTGQYLKRAGITPPEDLSVITARSFAQDERGEFMTGAEYITRLGGVR